MKNNIVLSLILVLTVQAANAMTHFQQLVQDFKRGSLPTAAQMDGWWTGRCYLWNDQNTPTAQILVGAFLPSNHGPGFPPATFNYVLLDDANQSNPARFDNLSQGDRQGILNFMKDNEFKSLESFVDAGSLSVVNPYNNGRYLVRKVGSNFVSQIVPLRNTDTVAAGQVYQACYYFRNVR